MKKTTINKIFTLLILSTGLLLAACSDGLKTETEASSTAEGYTISGKILSASENTGRMAFPSFNAITSSLTSGKMFVIATYQDGSKTVTTDAFYNSDTQSYEYALLLPSAGSWEVNVNFYCMSGDDEITIARAEPEVIEVGANYASISKNFVVKPFSNNEVTGSTNLLVRDQTREITKCVVTYSSYESIEDIQLGHDKVEKNETFLFNPDDNTCHICLTDLFPDNYEATLSFYKDDSLIYSRPELLAVNSGFVTDKWSGSHVENSEDGKLSYLNITQQMVETFAVPGDFSSPVVLWNKVSEEKIFETDQEDYYGIGLKTSDTFNSGIQIFSQDRLSGARISMPLLRLDFSQYYPQFSIDGEHGYVYVHNGDRDNPLIQVYKSSYSGMVLSESINLKQLLDGPCDAENNKSFQRLTAFTYYAGKLYLLFIYYDNSNYTYKYHFASYDLSTKSVLVGSAVSDGKNITYDNSGDGTITSIEIYEENNQLNLIYIENTRKNNTQTKTVQMVPFTESETDITMGSGTPLYTSGEDDSEMSNCAFTDMQIAEVNDVKYLYILLHKYESRKIGSKSGEVHNGSNVYFKNGDAYIQKALITSCGGIAKINLQDKVQENWSETVTYLGLYKGEYYTFNEENSEYTLVSDYMMQPPIEDADKYFYGPKRFVAKKPDQLVIADEGVYCDIIFDDDNKRTVNDSRNINRVVTVDLTNESMSAVDVNVGFTSTLQASSGAFDIYEFGY